MSGQSDALTSVAFFCATVGGLCVVFAVLAWVSDRLTQLGDRKTEQARQELRRAEFFERKRL